MEPIESFHCHADTKLPPGILIAGTFASFRASMTSRLNPCSSAVGCLGLYIVPFTSVPMGSRNAEKSLLEISPIFYEG